MLQVKVNNQEEVIKGKNQDLEVLNQYKTYFLLFIKKQ
jgi:hypothetical protein